MDTSSVFDSLLLPPPTKLGLRGDGGSGTVLVKLFCGPRALTITSTDVFMKKYFFSQKNSLKSKLLELM